ncbi:MAG: hypothetical protein E5Y65_26030 [Mesorhizobium sp.]|uniref:hypothetical protein n=1 Tax=Mesorhizobium sp. TaxID=1871066 RepID=UPI0011FB0413|nr:hypothetical protein [Mesorhizobium sp.]TIL72281.1 MAG: hypothetical protein E5Y70_22470 [Mesorhizobium sp.]TIL86609.1 MAG: hypothetical protein E5Y65_26030 [Mesorhizobium sp.]TIL98390.1 MAG: hypothetical protein E5Y64_26490 [Mesorhizobium sp.]
MNADIARGNVTNPDMPELVGVFAALGQLSGLWDGLDATRSAVDPTMTREAAALKYKAGFEKATTLATAAVRASGSKIMEARDRLRHEARGKAGLLATYPDTKEIRDVLRAMTQEDRDAAILHAVSKGDHAVIAALQAHELLVGPTSRPLKSIVDDFVAARAPEEMAKIQDLDTAEEHLTFAYQQFGKSIQDMRDLQAERDGEQGNKAAKEAEAKLGLALQAAAAPAQT